MLHILFFVLKITAVLLLAILGILILLLCMVLFIPANYVIEGKTENGMDNLRFHAKAQWLFHLFSAYYVYCDRKFDWQVRFGWKKYNTSNSKNDKEKPAEDVAVREVDKPTLSQEESDNVDSPGDKNTISQKTEKKSNIFEKIKCTILKIYDKIKSLLDIVEHATEFLADDIHKEAFCIVKAEIMRLAKHWHPRRVHGQVQFGFEDPYRTGQTLAILSVLYPFYGESVEIVPDFEQKVLIGDIYMMGHIRLWHLLMAINVLFFNKKVRKTYKDYKKIKP